MQITGTDQHHAWQVRELPPVERVRDGVWSIPIDFGHAPIRYTFCYLLTDAQGRAVLVDPGGDSPLGRSQLMRGLESAGVPLESVSGIVSTHRHADHLGMVSYLRAATGAWVAMHQRDAAMLAEWNDHEAAVEADAALLTSLGMPEDRIRAMRMTVSDVGMLDALARPTRPLEDGELLPLEGRAVRIVTTPGHTPGHVCLVDEDQGLVFTGDHVLPRITPNIGMTSGTSSAGALADYFRSLARISAWDAYEAAPAHEYRFRGIAARAEEIAEHHRARSREVRDIVAAEGPLSVWQAAERMSWSRPWESLDGVNLRAALSEAGAHLYYLAEQGDLVRPPLDADGAQRFAAAS